MPADHPQAGGSMQNANPENPASPSISPSATEKLRAFLRSRRYIAPEGFDVYGGDYRSSAPLGLVETADARHHRERLQDTVSIETETAEPTSTALESVPDRDTVEAPATAGAELMAGTNLSFSGGRCLHRYARREICRRCIDLCPNGAIQAGDPSPTIDQKRCDGCAACLSACPTEAIRWRLFSLQTLLQHVRDCLATHMDPGAAPSVLFIQRGMALPATESETPPWVVIEATPIGMIGAAALLSTLALGAARVRVLLESDGGEAVRNRLSAEIQWIQRLLTAWGFPGDSIGLLDPSSGIGCHRSGLDGAGMPPALFALDQPVPILTRKAAEHLARHGRAPATMVALPEGTPFGAVSIDASFCTLCMACAGSCRPKALIALNGDAPGLGFTESLCVQCGACTQVCPEQAIRLVPRMNPDPVGTAACLPLHQAQPARCSVCGRIFASHQMIATIQRKLRGHWMYNDLEGQNRLQMCDRCRVQALFSRK